MQIRVLLPGPAERVLRRPLLILQPGKNLQVALRLRRQFANMRVLEVAHLGFLLRQLLPRLLQLVLEKAGRIFRPLLPLLQVLLDKQVRQLAGRRLRQLSDPGCCNRC